MYEITITSQRGNANHTTQQKATLYTWENDAKQNVGA